MIARTRRRPRVRSCSFRTLGWLIRREAALRVILTTAGTGPHTAARRWIAALPSTTLLRAVAYALKLSPHRRLYP